MNRLRSLLLVGFGLAAFLPCASAETFPILEDASGSPITNTLSIPSGKAKTLAVSKSSSAYINFGVSASAIDPGSVTAARLVLFFPKAGKVGTLAIRSLTSSFTEAPVGRGPFPAPTAGSTLGTIALDQTSLTGDFAIFDVTQQVRDWLTTPGSEFGIAITSDGTATATLASKEGAASGHAAYIEVDVNGGGGAVSGTTASFTGPVGIGTTAPAFGLDVVGDGDAAVLGLRQTGGGGTGVLFDNSTQKYFSGIFGGNSRWSIYDITHGNAERLTVLANGNVGIGLPTPLYNLQVEGSGDTQIAISSSSANGRVWTLQSSNGGAVLGDGTFQIIDRTAVAARLIITKDGNVGMGGFPNSNAKLDVRGDIKLGSTGQFFAVAGQENLRTVRGHVSLSAGNPTALEGSGFTVARVGGQATGVFRVTFTTPFSDVCSATANAVSFPNSTVATIATVSGYGASFVDFRFWSVSGTLVDSEFMFTASGPK